MNALVVRKKRSEAAAQTECEGRLSRPVTPPLERASRAALKRKRRSTLLGTDFETKRWKRPEPPSRTNSAEHELTNDDITDNPEAETTRCRSVWLTVTRAATSHAGLFVILIVYTVVGGAIFQAIEGAHESEQRADLQRARTQLIRVAWQLANNASHFELFSTNLSQMLDEYDVTTRHAFEHGITAGYDMRIWDYWGSFFFSTTVYSTVGEFNHDVIGSHYSAHKYPDCVI